jgi:hypothetical protein
MTQKTEQLNHPAQNVHLLSIIVDNCSDALSALTELITEDFPRISNELQVCLGLCPCLCLCLCLCLSLCLCI